MKEKVTELGILQQTPTGWSGKVGGVKALPHRVTISLVPVPKRRDDDPTHCAFAYQIHDPDTGEQVGILTRSKPGAYWSGRLFDMAVRASIPSTVAKADGLPRLILNWRVEWPLMPFNPTNPPPLEQRKGRADSATA